MSPECFLAAHTRFSGREILISRSNLVCLFVTRPTDAQARVKCPPCSHAHLSRFGHRACMHDQLLAPCMHDTRKKQPLAPLPWMHVCMPLLEREEWSIGISCMLHLIGPHFTIPVRVEILCCKLIVRK